MVRFIHEAARGLGVPLNLGRKHKDECFCEKCNHKKATDCIEIYCKCCVEADQIRLEHPVTEESEEKSAEEKYEEEEAEINRYSTQIDVL